MLYLTVKLHAENKEPPLNRNQLQLMSGVTLPLLNRYWSGTTTEIRLDALERIANALRVSPGRLIMTKSEIMKEFGLKGWQSLNRPDTEDVA